MENKENKRAEVLEKLFAMYPTVAVFFLTSDDQAFTLKNDADNHAKILEDKTVDEEHRPKAEKEEVQAEDEKPLTERQILFARHKELFGVEPASNIGTEKLKAKIAEKEAEIASATQTTTDTSKTQNSDSQTGADGGTDAAKDESQSQETSQ